MKKLLTALFFPFGLPYPAAVIYHLILGGFLAFGAVYLIAGPQAASSLLTGIVGPVAGILFGLLVYRFSKAPSYTTEAEAAAGLQVSAYPGKWKVAQNRVSEREPYLTGTAYWSAVREYYFALGGE